MKQNLLEPQVVVLDTNVVLDWLVFANPDCIRLGEALSAGKLHWVATPAMRQELAHVLGRGHLDPWSPDLAALWACWDLRCDEIDSPLPPNSPRRLRCSDPDDQMFIDLALAVGADWLLTRDRAVLKLARRLREHGIETTAPNCWTPSTET